MESIVENVQDQPHTAEPISWQSPEFGAIYEEHSKAVYYLALRMMGEPSAAEDATHDIFIKAFRGMKEFRGEANLRTWLYRIAINHCRNLKQSWHNRHMFSNADDSVFETSSHEESPLQVLERKELAQRIQATMDALPDEYRLLLLLIADEKMSYDEVAELTDQSPDAVRGKLHRARKAFQQHFNKNA